MKILATLGLFSLAIGSSAQSWLMDSYHWDPSSTPETEIWDQKASNENWSTTAILIWQFNVTINSHYTVTGDTEAGPTWSLKVRTLQDLHSTAQLQQAVPIPPMSGASLWAKFYRESGWEKWKRTVDGETTFVLRSLSANNYLGEYEIRTWSIVSEEGGGGAGN